MPLSIDTSDIPPDFQSSQVQVYWRPFDCDFRANFQSGQWKVDDIDYVRDLCSSVVSLKKGQSKLEQKSIIQLLNIASDSNISISCVTMDQSFDKIDEDEMMLTSGVILPKLLTLEKIQIEMNEQRGLTEDEVINICAYARKFRKLTEIAFGKCLLPLSFSSKSIAKQIINVSLKVYWHPFDCDFRANFQSGQWEVDDIDYLRDLCSSAVTLEKKQSKLQQRSIIQILNTASNHDVSISCVTLDQSLDKIDKDEMILTSLITLPKLLTLEKTHIETKGGLELTEDDVINISTYALQSKRLKELSFGKCLLPLSFSSRSISNEIINRNVKVTWCRYGYRFDFQSGLWEVDDVDTVRRLCSSRVDIERTNSKLLQKWTIQLLKNASDNGIPITEVWLYRCSPRVNKSDLSIRLDSGLSLPILNSLRVLSIYDFGMTLTIGDFVAFLRYSSECTSLDELRFWLGYTLPETVPPKLIPPPLIDRNVKVLYTKHNSRDFILNFETGRWEECEYDI